MSNEEFDVEFDILYNNVSSNLAPGLSVYEKSLFLTLAQDLIIKSYLNPKTNRLLEGYDGSPERHIDFADLTTTDTYTEFDTDTDSLMPLTDWHKEVSIDNSILLIINEVVVVNRGEQKNVYLQCVPISYEDYVLTLSRVYKFPTRNMAWRIINNGNDSGSKFLELIAGCNDIIVGYIIKYIRKPRPIILKNLAGSLTIEGDSNKSECELDPIIHRDILYRAVELAKGAYASGSFNDIVSTGLTSATNLRMVSLKGDN